MSESWIETARAVAEGRKEAPRGWQVVPGERPVLVDAETVRGVVAVLVAALAWTGAVFREVVAGTSLDPLALFMSLLALAMTTRAVLLIRPVFARIAVWLGSTKSVLVLTPEGLWARLPSGEASAERDEILGVAEPGSWQTRSAGRRYSPVYVVLSNPGLTHITLPPVFDATPGVLAERLMRWRGAPGAPETPVFPEPASLASKVYDDAAQGIRDPRTLVVRHGDGWIRRGPWATVLLAVAVVLGFVRASSTTHDLVSIAMVSGIALTLSVVPIAWILYTRRSIAPRRGLALVLTPAELLMRVKSGVLRVGWPQLQRLSIDVRGRLSLIEGWAVTRSLVIKRKDGGPIVYDEAFLGVPAEVALTMCEAYASGVMSAPEAPSA